MEEALGLLEEMKNYGQELKRRSFELEKEIEEFGGKGTLIKEKEELEKDAEWFEKAGEDFDGGIIEKILVSRV